MDLCDLGHKCNLGMSLPDNNVGFSRRVNVTAILRSIATANPSLYVTQEQVFECYNRLFDLAPEERELYRRLLLGGPVRGRYVGMDDIREAASEERDALHGRFLKFGRAVAGHAATKALKAAQVKPEDVRVVVTNTCTGYLCPGMSSYLVEDLGLSHSVRVFDLMGMGCGGVLPNWDCAVGALRHGGPALSVAFEICSSTLFMGNAPDLVVSNSIFGDGAAAAVLDTDGARGILRILDFESGVSPRYRQDLRYRWDDGRLRNMLSRRVPAIGAREIHKVTLRLLERNGLSAEDIRHWAVHPGGTMVLECVAREFGIEDDLLLPSRNVFAEYGNMSSPSVLFCLRKILADTPPRRGELGVLLAFGAGFTSFAALVQFGHD